MLALLAIKQMSTDHPSIIANLARQVQRLEGSYRPACEPLSTGCAALDDLLPDRGFRPGTLVEWLAAAGAGAIGMSLVAAQSACRASKALVVIDPARQFYPLAAANLQVDLARTIVV